MSEQAGLTTPAGRLLAVLELAKTHAQGNSGVMAWQALAAALNVEQGNTAAFYARYSRLARLPKLLRDAFATDQLRPFKGLIERLHVVEGVLSAIHQLGQSGVQVFTPLNDAVLDGLRHADDLLKGLDLAEKLPDSEEVRDLADQLAGLRADLDGTTDLPADVRDFFVEGVSRLQDALREVDLVGTADLTDAALRVVGEAVCRSDVRDAADRPVSQRFWDIVAKAVLVVGLANGMWTLTGHVLNEVSGGHIPVTHGAPALPAPREPRAIGPGDPPATDPQEGP